MKNARNMSVSVYLVLLTAALLVNVGVGCGNDKPAEPGGGGSAGISIDEIILNPKSPSLGDTLRATAVVTGAATPGDFVSFSWTASGGTLVDTDRVVVRWVAPTAADVVKITVSAKNSASSATASSDIFVNDIQTYLANRGGELKISVTGDSLISQFSPQPPDGSFIGWGIRVNQGANERIVIGANQGASNIRFSNQLNRAAFNTTGVNGLVRMNYLDMVSGVRKTLPNTPFAQRGPQYKEADFLPGNSNLMTYQVWWPDQIKLPQIGGVDTFQVAVYHIPSAKERRVVTKGRNFHPTFSSDGKWLTFASDRSGRWEYHAVRVNGTSVQTDSINGDVKLTSSGGQMGPDGLPKAWSPSAPIMAIADKLGALWLVTANGSSSVTVPVAGAVREFVWAPSGDYLVVSAGSIIYRVTPAGAATVIHQAPAGDKLTRLAISSDENFLLYLATRLDQNWYELVDLTGVAGLTAPLRITPADGVGRGNLYGGFFSLSPVWIPNQAKAYMLFFDGNAFTPKIGIMDFSGLLPSP